ncbi:conserved hypothetical protein [Rhodospirillaceae bacterium LM-1]|nr:conserved hypothetical protein [Rhodospirillaceae bacterium LM-1]
MVALADIVLLLGPRKKRLLDIAELIVPKEQFRLFRKNILNELGKDGFEGDLHRLLERQTRDRAGNKSA